MFILKKGHQPGVYKPLGALFLVVLVIGKAQFRRAMLSCDSSCYCWWTGKLLSCQHLDFALSQQDLQKFKKNQSMDKIFIAKMG